MISQKSIYCCVWSVLIFFALSISIGRVVWDFYYADTFIRYLFESKEKSSIEAIIMGDSVLNYAMVDVSAAQLLEQKIKQPVLNAARPGLKLCGYPVIIDILKHNQIQADYFFIQINPILIFIPPEPDFFKEWKDKISIKQAHASAIRQILDYIQYIDTRLSAKQPQTSLTQATQPFQPLSMPDEAIDEYMRQIYHDALHVSPKVLFFITPLDLEKLQQPLYQAQYDMLLKRIALLKHIFQEHHIPYVDLHQLIPQSIYFPDTSLCHLTQDGMQLLIDTLWEHADHRAHE